MITAIVLAAGLSTRMGQSKPLLPFGPQTVIERIVSVLQDCPLDEILVITGHQREAVERRLHAEKVRAVFNPDFARGEMLSSLRLGLQSAADEAEAALVVLGDQPAVEPSVVEAILAAYRGGRGDIVAPSYQMRRGHPWLVGRPYWGAISALGHEQTLRDFFRAVGTAVSYVVVNTSGVLRDMDTPADYERELSEYLNRPGTHS